MQSVLRDVAEQRKAREALAEREQRFRDVLEASGEYVWETDAQWRYTYLSERVESGARLRAPELIGRRRASSCRWARRARWRSGSRATRAKAPFRDLMHRSITKSGSVDLAVR